MIKRGIKRGFTLVEILVAIAIIAVLSGVAYIGIQRSQSRGMNERMADDLNAIVSALEQYKKDKGNYPDIEDGSLKLGEDKNVNCFELDTTYSHDCAAAAFIQTQVDNILLTKRYLQEVPTDPRTDSRYMYGVTADGQYYQVAGNWLNDDGTYTAKVVGNLVEGYELASLIRAFDGPNFVMDGEGYLPYSPDHLSITAKLDEVTGTVTVDGQPATNGMVVSPGSIVETVTDTSSVIIYFSDGSISYLDGLTKLSVLPNTAVEKNDKDGIITKIRIKIFSGKIWSKVARLAQESEFNVETTSSIAGVRGTEFGISNGEDPAFPELIVLSGSVAARKKNSSDVSSALPSDPDETYLVFDSSPGSGTFGVKQVTPYQADSTELNQFTPPSGNNVMPAPVTVSAAIETYINDKFYKGAFNNNIRPRILKIDTTTPPNVGTIMFKLMEGVHSVQVTDDTGTKILNEWFASDITINSGDQTLSIPATLAPGKMANLVRYRFVDAKGYMTGLTTPVTPLGDGLVLLEQDIYNLLPGLMSQNCSGNLTSVKIIGAQKAVAGSHVQLKATAFYDSNCQKDVTSQSSWLINAQAGAIDQNGTLSITADAHGIFPINCTYQAMQASPVFNLAVLTQLEGLCYGSDLEPGNSDDNGYWHSGTSLCWVLGAPGKDCDTACTVTLGVAAACDTTPGWNDTNNCEICKTLMGGGPNCTSSAAAKAPFFDGTNTCYYRANPNSTCTILPSPTEQRVCPCTLPSVTITSLAPASIPLGMDFNFLADTVCKWTIEQGGGILTNPTGSTTTYKSMDLLAPMDNQILDVKNRFGQSASQQTKIRCTNPVNVNDFDEKTFDVTYVPFKVSALSNYEYSWFAQGASNWFEANATCMGWNNPNPNPALQLPQAIKDYLTGTGHTASDFPGLKEGGNTDWHLPEKAVYDPLDGVPNDNKTKADEGIQNWCGVWNGNSCPNMPTGVASIWLKEEDSQNTANAYIVPGANNSVNILPTTKTTAPPTRGFRCVR